MRSKGTTVSTYEKQYRNRYYNANYQACCIVAVVNYIDGVVFDWAAYINGVDYRISEAEAVEWVADHGCKISAAHARAIFPDIIGTYRY